MRIFYNIALHIGAAAAFSVLLPAVLTLEKRRKTVFYRLGLRLPPTAAPDGRRRQKRPCWVHALSVGEVLSALPLIRGLKRRWPGRSVVLSASTLSGFELARRHAAGLVDGLYYFPYDLPFSIRRVADAVSPRTMVLVETDLWPNFLHRMSAARIPVVLVNARLSQRTFRGYRKFRPLVRPMLGSLIRICTQSPQEAERFAALGVRRRRLAATGNLKFDQEEAPPPVGEAVDGLRKATGLTGSGPVLVAGSTHPGEEAILAGVFAELKPEFSGLQMVVAPRDPGRAAAVCRILEKAGLRAACLEQIRSGGAGDLDASVVDRIGLLRSLYGIGDVAFVGGSLYPFGGHNPLEPAAHRRPVIFGPDMGDFPRIADDLLAAGGAVQVKDAAALAAALRVFFRNPKDAAAAGACGYGIFASHRGAVERTLDVIDEVDDPSPNEVRAGGDDRTGRRP
ncbi:MAG: 3-deoxy-D-manno-octulosonic acid transferase [Desulfobacterales bacterium]|jgi:3-deoxy-D-manno-octulosonic-acid transferase